MLVDFRSLKEQVSIDQVLSSMLGVELKEKGHQLRGKCPIHHGDNPRQFVVTPEKGVWYCFGDCDQGGDMIRLVARMRDCSEKDAAAEIAEHFGKGQKLKTRDRSATKKLDPLDYLQPHHEDILALGISEETYRAFGAGYAPKGIMRGRLALPIIANDGTLVAYVGRAVKDEQDPLYLFPKGFDPDDAIFNAPAIGEGELYVTRDPLSVLKAHESGIENCIALIGDITPRKLELLAFLMSERGATTCELF